MYFGAVRGAVYVSNPQIKERAYKTFVRPILEYSSTVWDPYTSAFIREIFVNRLIEQNVD